MENLGIPVKSVVVKKGRWLAWSKPELGLIKVNTDGSKRSESTTGGGILRDANGLFLFGFGTKFTHQDILKAELEAILEGILVCNQLQITNYILETDSSLAYTMILNTAKEHWSYSYLFRRIREAIVHTTRLRLIYREENKAADLLAKVVEWISAELKSCL